MVVDLFENPSLNSPGSCKASIIFYEPSAKLISSY